MEIKSLLSSKLKKGLQEALQIELQQASLWKSLANQMQRLGYFGTQKYFLAESAEELTHYQIIADFMNDMGDVAQIPQIEAIKDKAENIGDALDIGYQMEREVMDMYRDFSKEAFEECQVTYQFLLQFLEIQRKAVGHYGDLLAKYKVAEATKEILEFDEHIND